MIGLRLFQRRYS